MNLTAITEYEKVQTLHFLDSLTVASIWDRQTKKPHPKVIDIGRVPAAGYPAENYFPADTIDTNGFDEQENHFSEQPETEAGIERHRGNHGRAEELAHQQYRESYDLVLARGLAPMPTLAEITIPFCKIAGRPYCTKKAILQRK